MPTRTDPETGYMGRMAWKHFKGHITRHSYGDARPVKPTGTRYENAFLSGPRTLTAGQDARQEGTTRGTTGTVVLFSFGTVSASLAA